MFYVLNFCTHEFRSCDTVDKVVNTLSTLQEAAAKAKISKSSTGSSTIRALALMSF